MKDRILAKISAKHILSLANDRIVNGKSAIEWVLERYAITTHKDSGIVNYPNDWADEVGEPAIFLTCC